MKPLSVWIALALMVAGGPANAQQPEWQKQMENARRAAAAGTAIGLVIRPGDPMEANWPAGVYVFWNSPRPFCYAFVVPGDWSSGPGGVLRSRDGRSAAGVTFWPPGRLEGVQGASLLERARKVSIENIERMLRQPLVDAELVPFESARSGTWRLKAAPISARDGRTIPFPLNVVVDLSPHTFAEVNVFGTADDEALARRIIGTLRTTTEPGCYLAEVERMYRAWYPEAPGVEPPKAAAPKDGFLKAEPPPGGLRQGESVLVDDGSCPADEVKEVIGGYAARSIPRTIRCVKRPAPR